MAPPPAERAARAISRTSSKEAPPCSQSRNTASAPSSHSRAARLLETWCGLIIEMRSPAWRRRRRAAPIIEGSSRASGPGAVRRADPAGDFDVAGRVAEPGRRDDQLLDDGPLWQRAGEKDALA